MNEQTVQARAAALLQARLSWPQADACAQDLANAGLLVIPAASFDCPAVMHHGPGSQSQTRCERRSPHDLDGEHYARNPMEPGFEWAGRDGWGNR